MPIDPGLDAMLQAMVRYGLMGLSSGTPEAARRGFRAVTADARPAELVIPVGAVEDGELAGPAGPLRTRTYRPDGVTGPVPTVLFLHGGGWVIGDLDTHDNQARRLCRELGAVVVSAEYRLAPEDPFPAAVEDAWAALRHVGSQLPGLGGDPARLVVAGDSAGANLAAVVSRRARDAGGPAIAVQFLIYPGVDFASGDGDLYPSRTENGEDKLLTATDLVWFAAHYVGAVREGLGLEHPDLSPIRAPDLSGLPHAVVVTAEFDPLRDEGEAYAAALEKAGTPVTAVRMDGMIHGFFDLGPVSPAVEQAVLRSCELVRDALALY